jgi:hypothetical protein
VTQPFKIDQTKNTGQWDLLGVFDNPWDVVLTNNADGAVVVDVVRFQSLNPDNERILYLTFQRVFNSVSGIVTR